MLLAIDTSVGTSVAVVDRDGGVLAERSSPDARGHAETVGTFIAECLEASGVSVSELSGVAVGMGPGPFTGLRVGIAAARAFALGAGKPVVPVVSHDAIAWQHYRDGHTGPLTVTTGARRREVFRSEYSGADAQGLPQRIAGPELAPAPDEGASARVSAGVLGLLAEALYAHGRPFGPDQPLYLRPPDATIPAGPKRVSA